MSILDDVDLAIRVRRQARRHHHVDLSAPYKTLHGALAGRILLARCVRSAVRFGVDLRPGSKRELSGYYNGFVGLNTAFNDYEIAILALSGFNWPKIHCIVRLQHKDERTILTDLHRLRRDKARIFDRVED